MNNRTVIVITGPTASGKTSLGVSLALALCTEVVSADSMQLYRGMDIGSAKPTREEMRGVPHHMIDVADPAEDYSVSRWVENAAACCDALLPGAKRPSSSAGRALYRVSSLRTGFFRRARRFRRARSARRGYDALGGAVFGKSCGWSIPSGRKSSRRATKAARAMEVWARRSPARRSPRTTPAQRRSRRGMLPPLCARGTRRETLYARIRQRDEMVAAGFLKKWSVCSAPGFQIPAPRCRPSATKEIAAALRGECSPEDAIETVSANPAAMPSAGSPGCGATGILSGCRGRNTRRRTIFAAVLKN